MKRILKIVSISIFSLVLISCGSVQNTFPKTEAGRSLEDIAPYGSNLVITYGAYGNEQMDNFSAIGTKLGLDDLKAQYMSSLNELLAESDLDLEEDIKPMLGENYRAMIAFKADGGVAETPEEDGVIHLYDNEYSGEFIVAFTVADTAKVEEFLNLMSKGEGMILGDKGGYLTLTDTVEGTHIMLLDDFVLMTTNDDYLDSIIARYKNETDSLSDDETYLEAFGSFDEPQFAYAYLSFGDVDLGESVASPFEILKYQIYGISARSDGLAFAGLAKFDEKEMKKLGTNLDAFSGPGAYLVDRFSADNLIVYGESYDLASSLRDSEALADQSVKDGFRALFGTDMEDGLFSWMDKGFVMMIQRADWIIPGFTMAFDASSNPSNARDFYLKLDGQLSGYMTLGQEEFGDAMQKETIGDLSVITIDLAPFDDGSFAAMFPDTPIPTLELTYGLTEDKSFVVSFQNGFNESYGKNVISDSAKYNEALGVIEDLAGGLVYFDFDLMDEYANEVGELIIQQGLAARAGSKVLTGDQVDDSAAESELRTIIKRVVDTIHQIDFVVFGSEIIADDTMKMAGYLKLK